MPESLRLSDTWSGWLGAQLSVGSDFHFTPRPRSSRNPINSLPCYFAGHKEEKSCYFYMNKLPGPHPLRRGKFCMFSLLRISEAPGGPRNDVIKCGQICSRNSCTSKSGINAGWKLKVVGEVHSHRPGRGIHVVLSWGRLSSQERSVGLPDVFPLYLGTLEGSAKSSPSRAALPFDNLKTPFKCRLSPIHGTHRRLCHRWVFFLTYSFLQFVRLIKRKFEAKKPFFPKMALSYNGWGYWF